MDTVCRVDSNAKNCVNISSSEPAQSNLIIATFVCVITRIQSSPEKKKSGITNEQNIRWTLNWFELNWYITSRIMYEKRLKEEEEEKKLCDRKRIP